MGVQVFDSLLLSSINLSFQTEIPEEIINKWICNENFVGKGSFGNVYKANIWGADVAIKELKGISKTNFNAALDEIILSR